MTIPIEQLLFVESANRFFDFRAGQSTVETYLVPTDNRNVRTVRKVHFERSVHFGTDLLKCTDLSKCTDACQWYILKDRYIVR
jgi:hypothetical protein